MKSLLLLLSFILTASPAAKADNDDIMIQSRVDQPSLSWLVDKTRLLISNAGLNVGTTGTAPIADIIIPMSNLLQDPSYKKVETMVGSIFGLDIKDAALRLRIPTISYEVDTIHANPKKLSVNDPNLELQATVLIQGVKVSLNQGIQADFMIKNPATQQMESYFTATLDPATVIVPSNLDPVQFDVDFTAHRDEKISFKLKNANLTAIPAYIDSHIKSIQTLAMATQKPLSADQLTVNPVIIKLSSDLSRSIQFDDFKPLVQSQLPFLIKSIMNVVGNAVQVSIGPNILQTVFSTSISSSLSVSEDGIFSQFDAALFSQPISSQLALGVQGDLCTSKLNDQYGQGCMAHMEAFTPARVISEDDQQKAKAEVTAKLASGEQDIAVSVTENYLNRLLKTSVDAGLLNDMLKGDDLELGPKGIFIVFDQVTQNPQIYLDLLYTGKKGIMSVIVNEKHPLHFPLRMTTSLQFDLKDSVPHITIKTGKLMSTADDIINGIPEFNLDSHLIPALKKKIASMILKMAAQDENQIVLSMDIPLFTGLGLEKTTYETSQYGRLNLYFKL